MKLKVKEILGSHYSQILSELEEIINTDKISLSIEITGEGFNCKLGWERKGYTYG